MYLGASCENNLALNRPAWSLYMSPFDPPSKAVDGFLTSAAFTGWVAHPFVAVDLGTSVAIGRISINIYECRYYIDGLVQDCSNSSALAMEFLQSCTKLSISNNFWCVLTYYMQTFDVIRPEINIIIN